MSDNPDDPNDTGGGWSPDWGLVADGTRDTGSYDYSGAPLPEGQALGPDWAFLNDSANNGPGLAWDPGYVDYSKPPSDLGGTIGRGVTTGVGGFLGGGAGGPIGGAIGAALGARFGAKLFPPGPNYPSNPRAPVDERAYASQFGQDATGGDGGGGGSPIMERFPTINPASSSSMESFPTINPARTSALAALPGGRALSPFSDTVTAGGGGLDRVSTLDPRTFGRSMDFGLPPADTGANFIPDTMGLSLDRTKALSTAADWLSNQASEFDFGPLREGTKQSFAFARENLDRARERTIGDLKAEMARSRVLGSSLAAGTLASAEAEFALRGKEIAIEESKVLAQQKLQEIDAKTNLMTRASELRIKATEARLNDTFKIAELGVEDAKIKAALTDSRNRILTAMKGIEADTLNTQLKVAAQEAESYRQSVLQEGIQKMQSATALDVAGIQGDVAKEIQKMRGGTDMEVARLTGATNERMKREELSAKGLGGLTNPLFEPILSGVGKGLASSLLSRWGFGG